MSRRSEIFGPTISLDGPNPNYQGLEIGTRRIFFQKGKVDIRESLVSGIDSGFSIMAQKDEYDKVIGYSITLRAKPDKKAKEVITEIISRCTDEEREVFDSVFSDISPVLTISSSSGISISRNGQEVLKIRRMNKSRSKVFWREKNIFTQEGEEIRKESKIPKSGIPYFCYEFGRFKTATGEEFDIFGGARFLNLNLLLMNHYFTELITRDELNEVAIREFIEPFIEARTVTSA